MSDLGTDLGSGHADCEAIAASAFEIGGVLDASSDRGANVTPSQIYTYFNQRPTGLAAF